MKNDDLALSVAPDGTNAAKQAAGIETKRSTTSRLGALVGGLALVGAAIGLVGVGISNRANSSSNGAAEASYSADLVGLKGVTTAGVKGSGAKGKADLDIHNVLTWSLRKLEPGSSGRIHIHAGRSCDALGPSLWDEEVTSSNPWTAVTWNSDSAGKSAGTFAIDELFGAYSFPANLGHAIVFYSHDDQILACGVLKPKRRYRKFGVKSALNNGFLEHQSSAVAGEVVLRKDNVLSWGVYNLAKSGTGVVSVLAGRDCGNPDATWFSGEWVSNKWGISKCKLVLDSHEHDFAEVVGRAVTFRDTHGSVVACDTLSNFVEKTSTALREVRAELRDIVDTYKSEGHDSYDNGEEIDDGNDDGNDDDSDHADDDDNETPEPPTQVRAVIEPQGDRPNWCSKEAEKSSLIGYSIIADATFVAKNAVAYDESVIARSSGTASEAQLDLIQDFEATQEREAASRAHLKSINAEFDSLCRESTECETLTYKIQWYEWGYLETEAEDYKLAVAAVEAGNATPKQARKAAQYFDLMDIKDNLDERLDEMDALCLPLSICAFKDLHDRCTTHQYWHALRYGPLGDIQYTGYHLEIADFQKKYQPALAAKESGTATRKQEAVLKKYARLEYAFGKSRTAGRSLDYYNRQDPIPTGNITLSSENILSWRLITPPEDQIGRIMIHEGTTCAELGGQAAREGTSPYSQVLWDTTEETESDSYFSEVYSTEGSVDLKTLDGTLPFLSNFPRAVVVYSVDMDELSCGVLMMQ